eukprot:4655172-Pleurochrysis_carterae.AAC.1
MTFLVSTRVQRTLSQSARALPPPCRAVAPVPDDCLGGEDLLAEELHRLWPAVHALPPIGDALVLGDELDLLVVAEVLPARPVNRQHDLACSQTHTVAPVTHALDPGRFVEVERRL